MMQGATSKKAVFLLLPPGGPKISLEGFLMSVELLLVQK
jgi:hypothetical protein